MFLRHTSIEKGADKKVVTKGGDRRDVTDTGSLREIALGCLGRGERFVCHVFLFLQGYVPSVTGSLSPGLGSLRVQLSLVGNGALPAQESRVMVKEYPF